MSTKETRSRSPRTEERILKAAAALFVRHGFAKTSMDEIARAAQVAKGTLYRYWPSKEALFTAVFFRELRENNSDFLRRIEADPLGGTIGAIVRHGYETALARPFLRTLMTTESVVLEQFLRRHRLILSPWQFRVDRQLVEQLQSLGVLRNDLDPGLLTYLLTVISLGLMTAGEMVLPDFRPAPEVVSAAIADLVQRAFGTPEGGKTEAAKEVLRQTIAAVNATLHELEAEIQKGMDNE